MRKKTKDHPRKKNRLCKADWDKVLRLEVLPREPLFHEILDEHRSLLSHFLKDLSKQPVDLMSGLAKVIKDSGNTKEIKTNDLLQLVRISLMLELALEREFVTASFENLNLNMQLSSIHQIGFARGALLAMIPNSSFYRLLETLLHRVHGGEMVRKFRWAKIDKQKTKAVERADELWSQGDLRLHNDLATFLKAEDRKLPPEQQEYPALSRRMILDVIPELPGVSGVLIVTME